MTVTQLILIIFALIAMFWGLYTLYQALKKPVREQKAIQSATISADDETAIEQSKDGLPIIPRHERPAVDEVFQAEITPDNPSGNVVLSADNTQLHDEDTSETNNVEKQPIISPSVNQIDDSATQPKTTVNYQINPSITSQKSELNATKTTTTGSTETSEGDDAFSLLANATETISPVVHTFDENQLKKQTFDNNSPILDTHIQAQIDQEQNSPLKNAEQNINISILPNEQFARIAGRDLLRLVDKYGMKYGAMNMFHRYEHKDGTGLLWFSMMMVTEDGILPFDLNKLPNQLINGLVLFLSLPHPKAVQGFDSMISVAGLIAQDLNASVYDETGVLLTKENTQVMRDMAISYHKP